MNIHNCIKQTYELKGKECKGVHVYINNSHWQNILELSTRFFPKTFNDKRDVTLIVSDGRGGRERYVISCQLSYNQNEIPVMIGLAIQSIKDEIQEKDLEKMVENSNRIILEVEDTRKGR